MLRTVPAIGPSGSASPPASRRAAPPLRTAERRLWPEATPCGVSPSYWNGNQGWRPEIPHPQGFPPCRDLLWQRAAGSPASVGFSPIRATAGSVGRRKPHTRRGSFLPCSPGGGRREAPRPQGFPLAEAAFWSEERGTPSCRGFPYGLTPVIEGSPGSPTPAGFSPPFFAGPADQATGNPVPTVLPPTR